VPIPISGKPMESKSKGKRNSRREETINKYVFSLIPTLRRLRKDGLINFKRIIVRLGLEPTLSENDRFMYISSAL
jgi:hypothetical protein